MQFKKFSVIFEQIISEAVNVGDIRTAIENKNVVRINYLGDANNPEGERVIDPYLVGDTIAGNPAIRAFQESGVTKTNSPDWKIFLLNKITSWEILPTTFEINPKYNHSGDQMFRNITYKI